MSVCFHVSCSPVIPANSSFIGSVRATLHVIDEGSQFRHHLMAAGIVEKHARRHRCERLQNVHEFAGFHRPSNDRSRHLRKAHVFAPCQAFDTAVGHSVTKKEAVMMGLLTPAEQPTPPVTQLAAQEHATVGMAMPKRAH
jgi:hypothetical protein